jgi:hypothetical protein
VVTGVWIHAAGTNVGMRWRVGHFRGCRHRRGRLFWSSTAAETKQQREQGCNNDEAATHGTANRTTQGMVVNDHCCRGSG